jgi:putative glutamine amidotransferase
MTEPLPASRRVYRHPGGAPRIGISACFMHPDDERLIFKGKTLLYLEQSMAHWVQSGGAHTYLVPTLAPGGPLKPDDVAADLDGLLLHGGADVCPRSYGEEPLRPEWEGDEIRDRYEIDLVRAFHAAGKPVLGICRGAQILNVAFGGTLYQDITTQADEVARRFAEQPTSRPSDPEVRVHRSQELYDRNLHLVDLVEGTGLAPLSPDGSPVLVNSVHHQAVKDVGEGLVVEARSTDDGVVEALRLDDPEDRYVFAVQWHPEFFAGVDDGTMFDNRPILYEFVDRALEARRASDRRAYELQLQTEAAIAAGPTEWMTQDGDPGERFPVSYRSAKEAEG